MALGRPLGAKLFLEGIEVPFIGATMTHAVGQASIAYIDLIPHKDIMDIKPRTKVELFVRNYLDDGKGNAGSNPFPYVIAWKGEVFGYNFGKTPTSRTFSISCIDSTSYWDCALTYYFNSEQSLGAGTMQKASGALELSDVSRTGERVIQTSVPESTFFRTRFEAVLKDKTKDFLDAFVDLYKYIGYVNDFFKSAEERLRISDEIVLHSSKQLMTMLSASEGIEWFTGIPGKSSGYSSLRSVINDLMSLIFHDFVPAPFPAAVTKQGSFASSLGKLPYPSGPAKTVGSYIFKPNLYMMPPPVCNIFFPDEYSGFQYNRNFFKEPTRLIYMPELPARFGQGAAAVYLPHVYEPPSFNYYMKFDKGDYANYEGEDALLVPKGSNPKHCLDIEDNATFAELSNKTKKEWSFLTNEEHMKGVWLSRESMVPATTQFRSALTDYDSKKNFSQGVAKYLFYKKRFQDRQIQITSHLKLSVMPGFPVLILDDSDADQNIVAYCSSVTHRIYATEGGYTNVQLSYARHIAEQDAASTHGTSMLIPPWFNEAIFGKMTTPPESASATEEVQKLGITHVSTSKLSEFYAALLGDSGSKALTNYYEKPSELTLVGAVRKLQEDYQSQKKKGTYDVQAFIAAMTSRSYVKMKDYYKFIGASTEAKDVENEKWIQFDGDVFTRKGKSDETPITQRRKIIVSYRDTLKKQRGFRG
jgi:hypothetical protein